MAEDRIKILEERLTRLESFLTQQPASTAGFAPPGGAVVDPPPWGGGGWPYHPRPYPSPIVDPAPWWARGWHPGWPPSPVVDPAPWPHPIADPAPWPHPIADPAPWPQWQAANIARATAAAAFGRIGHIGGDPPPPDISRFTVSQLESSLHSINAEKARLNSMEAMITQQLERLRKQEEG